MKVPQFSPWIGDEEYSAIQEAFKNNWITEGPLSARFSEKLLKLIGAKYGVFAPNGTLAIFLGLKGIGVKPGDEIIIPDFTFIGSATAVEMAGATPVFVDVNRQNFQIDLDAADKVVTKKTKAVMPVHIFGTVAEMEAVNEFAKRHGILVIEDAAEAIAVHRNGKHAGTFGEVGCFSFFADKTITTAEGGYVVTDDENIYDQLRYYRNQGRKERGTFIHPEMGYNLRLTDIQAAVGLVQLSKLDAIVKRKLHTLSLYRELLKDLDGLTFFEPPQGSEWIPFRVGILHAEAHKIMEHLKEHEIEPRSFFYPMHKQPAFSYLKQTQQANIDDSFKNAIYGYERGICLPTSPTLTDAQVELVCSTIRDYIRG